MYTLLFTLDNGRISAHPTEPHTFTGVYDRSQKQREDYSRRCRGARAHIYEGMRMDKHICFEDILTRTRYLQRHNQGAPHYTHIPGE